MQLAFADAGYQGPRVAAASPIRVEIVRKHESQIGFDVHARRWVVERFFAWIEPIAGSPWMSNPPSTRRRPPSTPLQLSCCYDGWHVDRSIRDGLSGIPVQNASFGSNKTSTGNLDTTLGLEVGELPHTDNTTRAAYGVVFDVISPNVLSAPLVGASDSSAIPPKLST